MHYVAEEILRKVLRWLFLVPLIEWVMIHTNMKLSADTLIWLKYNREPSRRQLKVKLTRG